MIIPNTIELFIKHVIKENKTIYKDNEELSLEYVLKDEDKITTRILEQEVAMTEEIHKETIKSVDQSSINVLVNKADTILTGKKQYVFVDVFNFIDYDITKIRGNALNLLLNGKKAAYTDPLIDGDEVEIFWS